MKTNLEKLRAVAAYLEEFIEYHWVSDTRELIALARSAAEDLEVAQAMITDLQAEANGLRPVTWKYILFEETAQILATQFTTDELARLTWEDMINYLLRSGFYWPGYGGLRPVIARALEIKREKEVESWS